MLTAHLGEMEYSGVDFSFMHVFSDSKPFSEMPLSHIYDIGWWLKSKQSTYVRFKYGRMIGIYFLLSSVPLGFFLFFIGSV